MYICVHIHTNKNNIQLSYSILVYNVFTVCIDIVHKYLIHVRSLHLEMGGVVKLQLWGDIASSHQKNWRSRNLVHCCGWPPAAAALAGRRDRRVDGCTSDRDCCGGRPRQTRLGHATRGAAAAVCDRCWSRCRRRRLAPLAERAPARWRGEACGRNGPMGGRCDQRHGSGQDHRSRRALLCWDEYRSDA